MMMGRYIALLYHAPRQRRAIGNMIPFVASALLLCCKLLFAYKYTDVCTSGEDPPDDGEQSSSWHRS